MIRHVVALLKNPTRRRQLTLAGVTTAAALLPGIGALGYETALFLSPVLTILAAMAAVDAVRATRTEANSKPPVDASPKDQSAGIERSHGRGARLIRSVGTEILCLHAISISLLILLGLGHSDDTITGLEFYLLGPGFASALGAVIGLWSATAFRRRALQILACWVPLVLSTGVTLWRLYDHPVVFAYDPFLGYFAGPIYDHDVALRPTYVWYRASNLVVAAGCMVLWITMVDRTQLYLRLSNIRRMTASTALLLLVFVIGAAYVALHRDELGFHSSTTTITHVLSARHTTEHFVIHYDPTCDSANAIEPIGLEHEFAWHQLEQTLGRAPNSPVHSFIFESAQVKRRLMGAGETEVAAPWRGHIYLKSAPFPSTTLHHELAHVFGAPFGDSVLGVSLQLPRLNLGLIEGFAVALERRVVAGLGQHELAAILAQLDRLPPLDTIMGLGFWTQAAEGAYNAAGSFCLWIMETRGVGTLTALYQSAGEFETVCHASLSELESEWRTFLETVVLRPSDVELWQRTFERPSMFDRRHAHQVAALKQEITAAEHQSQFDDAIRKQKQICDLEPNVPGHRLRLVQLYCRARRIDSARSTLDTLRAADDLSVAERSRVEEYGGDVALHEGNPELARAAYDRALAVTLPRSQRRALLVKRRATNDPSLVPLMEEYFSTFDPPAAETIAALQRWIVAARISQLPGHTALGQYLQAVSDLTRQDPVAAAPSLERARSVTEGDALHPELQRQAGWNLLSAYCQIGEYANARRLVSELKRDATNRAGDHVDLDRWLDRIEFFDSATAAKQ